MTVGEQLKKRRMELKLTLDQVAKQVGVTRQYIGFIEQGKRKDPSFKIMSRIASVYYLDLYQIVEWYAEQEESTDETL